MAIVVAASKVTMDLGVILAGLAVTSALLYFVGSELFGSDSTTAIFNKAVDRIREHPEVYFYFKERRRHTVC